MSNFQRTRSKVWWGDEPPKTGSPVAQQKWDNRSREEQEWEPQLPHWIANEPEQQQQQQRNNSADNIAQQPNGQVNQWPLRHGSPGSHKSQDSGFSDSDSSPPTSQYFASPEGNDSKNKSSSSSDSNNNENITVKQAIDFQNNIKTPAKDVVDSPRSSESIAIVTPIPKPRNRSSSVIQTPYDLQKYYEIHHDEEHMELLKDKDTEEQNKTGPKQSTPKNVNKGKNNIEKTKSLNNAKNNLKVENNVEKNNKSLKNVNKENSLNKSAIQKETKDVTDKNINIISPSKKYPVKAFVSSPENESTKVIKVATVKDLETSKNKSDDSFEYIKLSDNNQIAVNNQPRVRTPISNISYVPTERSSIAKGDYKRSFSNEDNVSITTTPVFQRNRLNKSLNFEGQRLDQQILDIQDGYHSLGYIDEEVPNEEPLQEQVHKPTKAILGKNIMDSLHLKPQKKAGPKAKQRIASRAEKTRDMFKIFPKKEKPSTVNTHAGGILKDSRVPSLGLPRTNEQNSWVIVGYPVEQEMLIPHYNERLVGGETEVNVKPKDESNNSDSLKERLTPPPQFQDKHSNDSNFKTDKDLTHDSKREKLKEEEVNFMDVQLNLACTSTPKMLAPHEYMNGTRQSDRKNPRRLNLLDNFSR